MVFKAIRIVMGWLLVMSPPIAQAAAHDIPGEPAAAHIAPPVAPTPTGGSALTGKPWRLEELAGEDLPGEQAAPYLLFTNSGDLVGFGGCNYFFGRYHTGDDGRIIVSSLRASHQQCQELSKRETTLLTSLLLANALEVRDDELTFLMNGSNLMKLGPAPDLSVAELVHQGQLLKARKAHKARKPKKARSKKKKVVSKSKRQPKTAAAKISKKRRPAAAMPPHPH